MSQRLFVRTYDVRPEMLLDFLQQALGALPTVTSYRLDDTGDRIAFTTSFTLTSWGENMLAEVQSDGADGSILTVSGEPRVGVLSTPWGEEIHAQTIEAQLFAALEPSIELARTNPIMMLQADHRRVESLFGRIQAAEGRAREQLVEELLLALRVHMELEETHVYPLLESEVEADLAREAEVEHQLARQGVDQLSELTPDEPGFDAALKMVMAGIEHHVQEEETEAFPRLTAQLGQERLARLAREITSARSDLLAAEQSASTSEPDVESNGESNGESAEAKPSRPARAARQPDRARPPRNSRKTAKVNPDDTTKADLVEQAKKAGVSGYSHMSKADLAKALAKAK